MFPYRGAKQKTGTMPVADNCHAYYGAIRPGKVQVVHSVVVASPVIRAASGQVVHLWCGRDGEEGRKPIYTRMKKPRHNRGF